MHQQEWDSSVEVWWANLTLAERRAAMTVPPSLPLPIWMVRTLKDSGVPGIVETRVVSGQVGPWYALPPALDAFLALQREQRLQSTIDYRL